MSNEHCLGEAAAIPINEGRAYEVEGRRIAVFRLGEEEFVALSDVCPHAGGSLAMGYLGPRTVMCPLHAWKFDLRTGSCVNDPNYRVRKYSVGVAEGKLIITMP